MNNILLDFLINTLQITITRFKNENDKRKQFNLPNLDIQDKLFTYGVHRIIERKLASLMFHSLTEQSSLPLANFVGCT